MIALALAGILAWNRYSNPETIELPSTAYFEVKRGDLLISVVEEGSLKSANEVVIRNNLEGSTRIISLVPEGSNVKQGDLLVELDASELKERINREEISYQDKLFFYLQAEENLKIRRSQIESNIKAAELEVELAQLEFEKYRDGDAPKLVQNAESRIQILEEEVRMASERQTRTLQLFDHNNASKSEVEADTLSLRYRQNQLDQSRESLRLLKRYTVPNTVRMHESNLEKAKHELEQLKQRSAAELAQAEADLKTSKGALEVMETAVARLKKQLEFTKIYAPKDGLVLYASMSPFAGRGEFGSEGRMMMMMSQGGFGPPGGFDFRGGRREGERDRWSRGSGGGGGGSRSSGGGGGGSFSSTSSGSIGGSSLASASLGGSSFGGSGSIGGGSSLPSAGTSMSGGSGGSAGSAGGMTSSGAGMSSGSGSFSGGGGGGGGGSRSGGGSMGSSGRTGSGSGSVSSSGSRSGSSSISRGTSSGATRSSSGSRSIRSGSSSTATGSSGSSGAGSGSASSMGAGSPSSGGASAFNTSYGLAAYSTDPTASQRPSSSSFSTNNMGFGSGVVEEGATVRQRQELLKIPDLSQMLAEVKIRESRVRQIQPGMPAFVRVESVPDRRFVGRVRKVAILPDSQTLWLNPDLKVYSTEVTLEEELPELKPGVSARAEIIITNLTSVLSVPVQAVTVQQGQNVCYVSQGAAAVPVPVTTGLFNDRFIEIKSGLKEGDRVLLAPPSELGESGEAEETTDPSLPANGTAPSSAPQNRMPPSTPQPAQSR